MSASVLVFISHSSDDKKEIVEPLVDDLEECYIRVWIDKNRIMPGDNIRKSVFKDGLDKADIALIYFTENSLRSKWVDREIKHVLRDERSKGNDFDLNKIISIFDSDDTYNEIKNRYPELTDDLLHLMPKSYSKQQLGQLISAIWGKYLSMQGGDIEVQRQLLSKDREIFEKDKEINDLKTKIENTKTGDPSRLKYEEFEKYFNSPRMQYFIREGESLLTDNYTFARDALGGQAPVAFGLAKIEEGYFRVTDKGREFFEWIFLNKGSD